MVEFTCRRVGEHILSNVRRIPTVNKCHTLRWHINTGEVSPPTIFAGLFLLIRKKEMHLAHRNCTTKYSYFRQYFIQYRRIYQMCFGVVGETEFPTNWQSFSKSPNTDCVKMTSYSIHELCTFPSRTYHRRNCQSVRVDKLKLRRRYIVASETRYNHAVRLITPKALQSAPIIRIITIRITYKTPKHVIYRLNSFYLFSLSL